MCTAFRARFKRINKRSSQHHYKTSNKNSENENMKHFKLITALGIIAWASMAAVSPSGATKAADSDTGLFSIQTPGEPLILWYRRPARQWVEALAVGNGRLGAMVFGGVDKERIQLNEDTLWGGGPYDPNNPEALAALPEVRRLIFEGKYGEANRLISSKMMAKPLRQMPYQTVGDLLLTFPEQKSVENYRRDLNLDTAVASVAYTADGVKFTREVFSSPVDQVIVLRLTADKPGHITFTAGLKTPQKATVEREEPDTLVLNGVNGEAQGIPGALRFQARVRVSAAGGKTTLDKDQITVTGADSATFLIAAATSYKNYKDVSGDPEELTKKRIAAASQKPTRCCSRTTSPSISNYSPGKVGPGHKRSCQTSHRRADQELRQG